MDWMKLDLSKASLIKREVDIALNTLSSYISGNDPSKLMNFVANIQNRVHEMDSFCTMYSEGGWCTSGYFVVTALDLCICRYRWAHRYVSVEITYSIYPSIFVLILHF